ncbi:hypothetical protein SAMN05216174_106264 [Actinokineospora iranica]|uniref:Uncharacterized protein n=1 Tax=Actinokineospora iranica TaxID=1271860 RepID=A0A1G6RBX1_9PSEU|nr:hypothetical protein SAMN05216174_106264 [Actinokineospora iranica]
MANRLKDSTSPYLLQPVSCSVNWYRSSPIVCFDSIEPDTAASEG